MLGDKIHTIFKDITNLQDVIDETKMVQSRYELVEEMSNDILGEYVESTKKIVGSLKESVERIHNYFDENFKDWGAPPTVKCEVGMIKLVDLSKLIDPNRTRNLMSEENLDNTQTIVLSDSGTDDELVTQKKGFNNNIEERKNCKSILKGRSNGLDTSIDKRVQFANNDTVILSRINNKESSSSDSDSESEPEIIRPSVNRGDKYKRSDERSTKLPNGAEIDKKFYCKCMVKLPRYTPKELKAQYMKKIADQELKRLTDWKSLKRSRTRNSSDSSSDSSGSVKNPRKKIRAHRSSSSSSSDSDSSGKKTASKPSKSKSSDVSSSSDSDSSDGSEKSPPFENHETSKSPSPEEMNRNIDEARLESIVDTTKEVTEEHNEGKDSESNSESADKDSNSNEKTDANSDETLKNDSPITEDSPTTNSSPISPAARTDDLPEDSPEDKGDSEETKDSEGSNKSSSDDDKKSNDDKGDGKEKKKISRSGGDNRGDRRSKKSASDSDTSDSDDEKKKKKKSEKRKVINDKEDEKKAEDTDDEKKNDSGDEVKEENEESKDDSDSDDKEKSKVSDTSEEDEEKKDKSKWKQDKLLTKSILNSDEEMEAFKKKKERLKAKENESDSDSPSKPVVKKKVAKKSRAKRVLSDSESDKQPSESSDSSDSDKKDSSDSEEERKKQEETKKKRKRIKKVNSSSDEDGDKSTRKQIRKVMHKDNLAETTIQAEKDEAERKARILDRQKKYNHIFEENKLEKATLDKVVLDFNEETREELLAVDKKIVKHLKPHQGKGVQFMWDACFESIDRAKNTAGSGCILAHCMGLGKTLQVITLCHTLISNQEKTGVEKVLVVCPLSTVLNWVAEFKKWLPSDETVEVYDLVAFKQNRERIYQTMEWHKHGGVLVLGYDMFRNLTNENNKRLPKKLRNDFKTALVDPGPDLVVCDEGHLLKNEKTSLSISMNKLKTARRIVLTGTPLQNNLKEYWCMVQFVKPNLLGTYKEYLNRFVNPIVNGQYTDSTQHDIQIMRKRSHVLHKMLDGVVQRRDYSVLAPYLPPKYEYVIFITLTETQKKMYEHYMRDFARQPSPNGGKSFLFVDFQELQRICTHPRVLLDKSIQNRIAHEKKMWENDEESEGSLKDFIDDGSDAETTPNESSSGSDSDASEDNKKKPSKYKRRTRAMVAENNSDSDVEEVVEKDNTPKEWWGQYVTGDELDNIVHSGKLHLLFEILHQCEAIGDKVLVFSQSLYSLNVIEYFLSKIDEASQNDDTSMVGGYSGSWALGLDYFRLDGSSSCDNRAAWCKTFNDPKNVRARLFLISTRAGGLGINLVAANRVIIFDVSWNPSHDIQSIYRVYRFGQTKPSYIYRFVTLGTMEMKIYERQVTKQAISKRVIDEQQIDRHYNQNDLAELYRFEPEPEGDRPIPLVPKDILLGELLQNYEKLIYKYHEHQSLLENKEDEVLDEEERKAAWEEFENEKKNRQVTANFRGMYGSLNTNMFPLTLGNGGLQLPIQTIMAALSNIVRREHPTLTLMEIQGVLPQVLAEFNSQMAAGESTMYMKVLTEIERMQQEQQQAKYAEYYKMQQQQQALKLMQKYHSGNTTVPQAQTPEFARYMAQINQLNQQQQMMNMPQQQMPSNSRRGRPPRVDPNEVVSIDD